MDSLDDIENGIILECINYTNSIVFSLNTKEVYIFIDGVAPRAKISQQRERRYKSHFFKELQNEKSKRWDSNKITPGTHFMQKLIAQLQKWATLQKSLGTNVYISDSNEPGEGEHKMMRIIDDIKEKICIYGLDSDLIFLSMLNRNSSNIVLIRDNSFQTQNGKIEYVDILKLKQYIVEDIKQKFVKEAGFTTEKDPDCLIQDYVLVCFMLGNDFLEHLHVLQIKENGIDILIRAYIKASLKYSDCLVDSELVKNKLKWKTSINLLFLRDILYNLTNFEDCYIAKGRSRRSKINIEELEKYNLKPNSNVFFYTTLYDNSTDFKLSYNNFYGINSDNIDDICFSYIEGLYWILGYYNSNIHGNCSWYYSFNAVPFCSDLFNFIKKSTYSSKLQDRINDSDSLKHSEPFSNSKQLCLVLPKESIYNEAMLLDNKTILTFLKKDNKYFSNIFPSKLYVDVINKEYLWQSKILFEDFNEDILDVLF